MMAGWALRGDALSIRGALGDLGTVLVHHEYGDPEPELGALLTAEAEDQGIAMLNRAWRKTALKTLVRYTDPANHRAHRAVERLGGELTEGPAGVRTFRYARL